MTRKVGMVHRASFWAMVLAFWWVGRPAWADPPDCKPRGPVAQMASKEAQAMAVGVWADLAREEDRRNGNHAARQRLDAEVGSVDACDAWGRAHGKPERTPGKGPKR